MLSRFNGYSGDSELDEATRNLIERREQTLAPSYNLFYSQPVEVASSAGAYLVGPDGTRYLDMYNNIPAVGHANPRVAKAVYDQMRVLNTHTRYLYPSLADFGQRLLGTMPTELDRLFLTNSGSEANDLAVRVARAATSAQGVIVTAAAYHGSAGYADAISPISRVATPGNDPEWLRVVPAPDPYREGPEAAARFAADVGAAALDLERAGYGLAAFFADMILSTDGVIPSPTSLFSQVAVVVHSHGGLFVADEVQSGFGRLGDGLWGFTRHGLTPDLVTMGKPMGNGFPVAGLAGRREVFAAFGKRASYFNTFGGSPVAVAAASAVLDEIEDRELISRSKTLGARLEDGIRRISDVDSSIGDVRGAGLFVAVEYVTDKDEKTPNTARALEVVARHRDRGVLISNTGAANNSLKIRPPLVIDEAGIDHFLEVFAEISAERK
ncbi:aspartate aminotransferase family protein [Leifsonia poae]|uniref:aspartate aminotransferase family protein n=1 Tax=Leifsonia poae TaxID=110933 RepID=UPI001CBF9B6A|nr:aminotransferase class III-fold pyridoxal phosphate-dependent enzyme [Leifsonia poae]